MATPTTPTTAPTIKPFTGGEQASFGTSQRGSGPAQQFFQAGLLNGKMINTPDEYNAATNASGASTLPNIQNMSTMGTQGYVNSQGIYTNPGQVSAQPNGTQTNGLQSQTAQTQSAQTQGAQINSPQNTTAQSPNLPPLSPQPPAVIQNTAVPNASNVGSPDLTQKYQQTFNAANKGQAPQSGGDARAAIGDASSSYQPPEQAYQPSQTFMQVGDPIMKYFVSAAMAYQDDAIQTGYAAKAMEAQFANQVQGIDLQAANIQNIMNGTRDDVRAEINKAGGFATESQVEGLVTSRNRDLLKQYNNIELQKQTMQNQMQLQVGMAQADHQYAIDKFDNLTKTVSLYKGIYDNATDQMDKLIQNVGYSGLAAAYNNDPSALAMIEQHLNMPKGTLSDPQKLQALETYRQRTLALSQSRFNVNSNLATDRFAANYGYNAPGVNTPGGNPSGGGVSGSNSNSDANYNNLPGGGPHPVTNPNVSYDQYGLLSKTNFDPKNQTDINANNYLTKYLNGELPSKAGDLGISVRGAGAGQQYNAAVARANDLYFAATGQNLPNPTTIKNNLDLINQNNTLANKLDTQELTVGSNIDLSLQNMTKNSLNSSKFAPLNGLIDYVKNLFNDPATGQLISQNQTIQNELGSLLAVKNASGTTVYDKLSSAGIISSTDTPANIQQKVATIIKEAANFKNALTTVNGQLYAQTDPLEKQQNNPNRQNFLNAQVPSNWVTMTGPKGTFKVDPKNVDLMKQNGYK